MTTSNLSAVAEVEVRERVDALVNAVRTGDLATLRTLFAPGLVSFDIEPPLRHLGAEHKMANWERLFAFVETPLEYDVHDLTVLVEGELAVAYSLNHMNATTKPGGKIDYWLRYTGVWRKIDGAWLVVHDQVSVPTNFESGTAAMDLTP
ncbi:nuclear transport factor 2 family protein [Kribbella sp. NPDC048915]|uniref:YybH family protein n=1 Tax=Kribbella sp. NPDC048915 TaxID=3155148 RepID=UPI0033F6CBE3